MKKMHGQPIGRRLTRSSHVLLRRWYVIVAVLVALLPGMLYVHNASGVYYSTVNMTFLPPPGTVGGGNSLRAESGSTVYYAALVERTFSQGPNSIEVPHPTGAHLYATGVRHGISVYLPNAGGQWQTNFNVAELRIEVVGTSENEVMEKMTSTISMLKQLSGQPQVEIGVIDESWITTDISPAVPAVGFAWIRNGRAELAMVALMLGTALAAAKTADVIIAKLGIMRRRRIAA